MVHSNGLIQTEARQRAKRDKERRNYDIEVTSYNTSPPVNRLMKGRNLFLFDTVRSGVVAVRLDSSKILSPIGVT